MKYNIYHIVNEALEFSQTYEADEMRDSSAFWNYTEVSPMAVHLAVPADKDPRWMKPVWVEEATDPETQIVTPAHWDLEEDATQKSDAEQADRNAKLEQLRSLRAPKLDEADIEINKLFDADSASLGSWKTYRQALRDVTNSYKSGDNATSAIDSVVLAEFSWPSMPE